MRKISIIIPVYNEEKRIGETLINYILYFDDLKKREILDHEFIFVLNGCKDDSRGVIEKQKKDNFIILEFERAGKGFAVTEGFKNALERDSDFIGFVDADGSTPPEAFHDLVKNIEDHDGVIANRWNKKSQIGVPQSLFRRIISRGFNVIVRVLFLLPHQDTQCGAKLFHRDLVEKVHPKLGFTEWSFDVDLLFYARREKAKIKSIPTTWNDKTGSVLNLRKTPFRMFFSVVRLRLVHSPFKFILRIHSRLPKKLQIGYWFN